jgi:hypothetical protein
VLDLYEARPTALGDNVSVRGRRAGIYMKDGLPIIIDDMLKNKLTAGTSGISKTYTYEFTNLLGFAAHRDVVVYPFRILDEISGQSKNNHRN